VEIGVCFFLIGFSYFCSGASRSHAPRGNAYKLMFPFLVPALCVGMHKLSFLLNRYILGVNTATPAGHFSLRAQRKVTKRPLVSAPALAAFAHPCAAKGSLLLGFTS
jgi:hypothetical protein